MLFFAKRPAPISTLGFDVFVQEVIAAINIEPSCISKSELLTFAFKKSSLLVYFLKFSLKFCDASVSKNFILRSFRSRYCRNDS